MRDKYGRIREFTKVSCHNCLKKFYKAKRFIDCKRHFCSIKCNGISNRNRIVVRCNQCSVKFNRRLSQISERKQKHGLQFCSRRCKDLASNVGGMLIPSHYNDGSTDYRNRTFKTYVHKCSSCGYSKSVKMMDADHIDGNRNNNHIDNLQILCIWCHTLKTRHISKHKWDGEFGSVVQSVERRSCIPEEAERSRPDPPKTNTTKRLSKNDVSQIRQLLKLSNISINKLSKIYNVSRPTIDNISNNI